MLFLNSVGILAQTPLVNGGNHPATLAAGESGNFSFEGSPGETVLFRVGATNFVPKIELRAPNGTVIATGPATPPSGGIRDTVLTNQLSTAGTFTVVVSSFFNGGSGSYGLHFAKAPGAFSVASDDDGGTLTNGILNTGVLTLGDLDSWRFTGNAGDALHIRMGGTNLVPRVDLFGPNGALIGATPATPPSGGIRDVELKLRLTVAGDFTVVVSSYYSGNVGGYNLTFVRVPSEVAVSNGDEGGALTNGVRHVGNVDMGDLDVWRFTASIGDNIQLRMGGTNIVPRIDLYGPDGAVVESAPPTAPSGGIRDTALATELPTSGMYTVVVGSYYSGGVGSYSLTLGRAPGEFVVSPNDEGGNLQNGAHHVGSMELGDLDLWTISANAGDNIQVRIGGTNFVPRLDLYAPNGNLLVASPATAPSGGIRDTVLTYQAAATGTFTIIASSYYSGNVGGYAISLAQAPATVAVSTGDEGGALTNGLQNDGKLTLGDLDVWSFNGFAGNSIQLRMSATDLVPRIDLYGPNGALVSSAPSTAPSGGIRDVSLSMALPATGTYTVVLSSYYSGGIGDYTLSSIRVPDAFEISPGDEGGALTNGWRHSAELSLGDFDVWTFSGTMGASIELRMGATNLVPRIDFYAPDGTLIESAPATQPSGGIRDVSLGSRLATNGLFTVVVSSYYTGNTGGYGLTLVQAPGALEIGPGDEGNLLMNGWVYNGTNSLGDIDAWTFFGTVGDSNVFRIGTVDFTPWLRLYDATGSLVKEAFSPTGGNRTNQMSYVVTNNGFYTLVAQAYFSGQSGTYNLKQSRVPPDLNLPAGVTVNEGETLNIPISAHDPDEANKTLTFLMQSPPAGVALNTLGPTNGVITWSTSEATGPVTNTFNVTVTDVVNNTSFTRTNSFTVVVNEVNIAPTLTAPADTAIDELTPLNLSASATDPDLPANPLTFSLVDPPAGMTINPNTGGISWTPTEAQGPGSYPITVVVTDDSPSAVNEKQLSATNSFTVTVREVNRPPQLGISDQVIDEGKVFNLAVLATDPDEPANSLLYAVVNPPTGLTINPATGALSWNPTEAQGPETNMVSVIVTDNNPAAANEKQLSTTVTFRIVVNEVNLAPVLLALPELRVNELANFVVTNVATDADAPANTLTYTLVAPPAGAVISSAGIISWTPTEAQGPTTNILTTIVTDNGDPALSATNTVTVIVNELNAPPVFTLPTTPQTTAEQTAFTLSATATDSDEPVNPLTYRLLSPPVGLAISPGGQITWTPTEEQGPTTNTITVVVTDASPSAATNQISVTNSFTLIVTEQNTPPVISDIPPQSVQFGNLLSITPNVTDSDRPTNIVTLSLEGAPQGMSVDSMTGVITWTPSETQVGGYTVTLRASDNGTPALTATKQFQVTVTGSGAEMTISQLANNRVQVTINPRPGRQFQLQRSTNLVTWETVVNVPQQEPAYTHIEAMNAPYRFYRLFSP